MAKLNYDQIKHIPNPFARDPISELYWSMTQEQRGVALIEWEKHNYNAQWLSDYVRALKDLEKEN
jgi:hypothetical protein